MFIISTKSDWIRLYLLFYCILAAMPCRGQIVQSARFELLLADSEKPSYKMISAGENGIVVYERAISKDNQLGMEIIRLDTAMKLLWKGFVPIEDAVIVDHVALFRDNLFILLRNPAQASGNFQVLVVNSTKAEYSIYEINNVIHFTPKEFVVTEAAVLIGGYFNYRPLVLYYSFATQKAKILPGFLNEPGELVQLKIYDNGAVDVIVGARNAEHQKCLWIRNYDIEGNLNKTIVLDPGPDKQLIFGQSVKMPGDDQVVAGVYGRHLQFSRGVFVAHIDPYGEYQINYYNFGDLQHFFS